MSNQEFRLECKKKNLKSKWISYTILFLLVLLSVELGFSFYHEEVHGAIYNQYGVNYTKGFMFAEDTYYLPAFYVVAIDSSYQLCNEVCGSLQTENEIITYNVHAGVYALWGVFMIWMFMKYIDESDKLKQEELKYDYPD